MARRTRAAKAEKGKQKTEYAIIAPALFNNKQVGELIGRKDTVINRIIKVALNELEDIKASPLSLYTTVLLRVIELGQGTVKTEFIGHEVAQSYLRSLARKHRSVIHEVIDVNTNDGQKIRLKIVIITLRKVSEVVKKNLRKAAKAFVLKAASSKTREELIKSILLDTFAKDLGRELNKINPVSHVIVRKSEQKIIAA
ncbi:MAG: hypothetical protein QXS91_03925 [Candidatus Anstonellales archaeon]